MNPLHEQKVDHHHLKREAYVYVRQSTLRQVVENTESTMRQYALREQAKALGWSADRVTVIDCDLGQSGASAADRAGFQRLVTDVGMGRVGIVLGLEVSRLARNNSDWHQLLEICALTETLILDEEGLYDPRHFNDRLLLGLKGTMSEAELHLIRARLQGGIMNKAKRGELRLPLPIGFVYGADQCVQLDPDLRIQATLQQFFQTFQRTRSAAGTAKEFHEKGIKFPHRVQSGPSKGEVLWGDLVHQQALTILHNPRYAGAFFFGRRRSRRKKLLVMPMDQWYVLIKDAHPGYLSWNQYEANQEYLRENQCSVGAVHYPPGDGPALLQGLLLCGVCGRRMSSRYQQQGKRLCPTYCCFQQAPFPRLCQTVHGGTVDRGIEKLLLDMVTPLALETALTVHHELVTQRDSVERLLRQQVERASYDAELARRRYMQVDPDNRLVADTLETEWNTKLRALSEAKEKCERDLQKQAGPLSEEQQRDLLQIATDFPRLWHLASTTSRERKRIVRLLIEDVTLSKTDTSIEARIRFKGGTTRHLSLPRPLCGGELRRSDTAVIQAIDRLLEDFTEHEVAASLNKDGYRTGTGRQFTAKMVMELRRHYGLKARRQRLADRGMLTPAQMAALLGICTDVLLKRHKKNPMPAHRVNNKGAFMYVPPKFLNGDDPP
jgi:DNA invertase Pin-like site-specific DNA recombinase